ncbi:MAG: hypothetical protein GXO92_03295 [FCB group bacterium]|nr:hypothetical protein [FCB group bacterium]
MINSVRLFLFLILTLVSLPGKEFPVVKIRMAGEINNPAQEISGLAWHGNNLILLPQYPNGYLYSIPKDRLLSFINGESDKAIMPEKIKFITPDYKKQIPGFEGYEALAFAGDEVFMVMESKRRGTMKGHVVKGFFSSEEQAIRLYEGPITEIDPPVNIKNMAYEAVLLYRDQVITFFEANGPAVNPRPRASRFTETLRPLPALSFPPIEYRITDVTAADRAGNFWAINYFWPGDRKRLRPGPDPLIEKYGQSPTQVQSRAVERLLKFTISERGVRLVNQPPVELELIDAQTSRNWEGIARLDKRGFLVVTDEHPGTILAFIPYRE